MLLTLRDGVATGSPAGVLLAGLAHVVSGSLLRGETDLAIEDRAHGSRIVGRLPVPMAVAGREGGNIGLCNMGLCGAKKLDLRFAVPGVDGS